MPSCAARGETGSISSDWVKKGKMSFKLDRFTIQKSANDFSTYVPFDQLKIRRDGVPQERKIIFSLQVVKMEKKRSRRRFFFFANELNRKRIEIWKSSKTWFPNFSFLWLLAFSFRAAVVESTPGNREVVGSNPSGYLAFSLILLLNLFVVALGHSEEVHHYWF